MTIRRRLFLSNIFMVLIPVVLCATFAMVFVLLYFGEPGMGSEKRFYYALTQTKEALDGLEGNAPELRAQLQSLSETFPYIGFSLYEGEKRMYGIGSMAPPDLLALAISSEGEHLLLKDSTAIYRVPRGIYTVYLTAFDVISQTLFTGRGMALFGGALCIVIILSLLFTNKLMTQIVLQSIAKPLNTLAQGVHEISNGNLDYRITHFRRDEFQPVCEDFNEMAHKLKAMVKAREKDERNRRELIAGISHDLRTPLTAMLAYLEGLQQGVANTPEKQRKYLETIWQKTKDMEYIINQLFLFSRLDVGEFPLRMEKTRLREELRDFLETVREEYGRKGLRVTLEKVEDLEIVVDSVQLRAVFVNFLENSVKYGDQHNGRMFISAERVGNRAVITFRDNGSGVSEESLDRLFDVFYRGDKARNTGYGSGLGLAISAKLVESMKGTLYANNAPEGGLGIHISLPVA